MKRLASVLICTTLLATAVQAATVTVTATGTVIGNRIADPPLSGVGFGETATMSFTVDSNNFVDGIPGDTRGYVIDESSFSMSFSGGVSVGLENPFPAGDTPYFTLVDGFPVSDGFFVSTSPISPGGVPLDQTPINANLDLGYDGATLSSLDILDAVGDYGFAGLTRFGFTLWQVFPDNAVMEMDFVSMSIVPEPGTLVILAPLGAFAIRRLRRGRTVA